MCSSFPSHFALTPHGSRLETQRAEVGRPNDDSLVAGAWRSAAALAPTPLTSSTSGSPVRHTLSVVLEPDTHHLFVRQH